MSLLNNYRILHKGCDGQISKRTCSKCKRHWELFESWFTFDWYHQKIRKQKFTSDKPEKSPRKFTGNIVADTLPNWPRWARISSVTVLILIIVGITFYVF